MILVINCQAFFFLFFYKTCQIRQQKLKKQHKVQQSYKNQDNEDSHSVVSLFREETHMLEIPIVDSPVTIALLENNSVTSKPVPVATVRSSKLAAMAANMNKSNEVENDIDVEPSNEVEDDIQETDSSLVKLEDILIVPEILNNNHMENDENGENSNNSSNSESTKQNNDFTDDNHGINIADEDNQIVENKSEASHSSGQHKYGSNKPNRSDSVDLSLSCVNSSGISDAAYRLGSMEEMDNHLETMQTELDNLREILRGEGYSIDANTLLGDCLYFQLFGAEDSSMSFGIPVNSDLDTHCDKEEDDHAPSADIMNGGGGGELMAYNPAPSLLDFDDDIFLGATTSSPVTSSANDTPSNNLYTSDPLDLEDNKTSLLESYAGSNENSSS